MTRPENLDIEAPDADAAEQATPVNPDYDEETTPTPESTSLEASEWDVLEQSQTVRLDDEDEDR
jgi:hypothetical protein